MDWNGLLNFQDDPKRNMLMQVGLGLLAGNQSGNPAMGAMRGFQNAQEMMAQNQRLKMMQEQFDMQKDEYDRKKKQQEALEKWSSSYGVNNADTVVPGGNIPAPQGTEAPNFGLVKAPDTVIPNSTFDENKWLMSGVGAGALSPIDLINLRNKTETPVVIGDGGMAIDPRSGKVIASNPKDSNEKQPDLVRQFMWAAENGYIDAKDPKAFEKFKQWGAMNPVALANLAVAQGGLGLRQQEAEYNLPAPTSSPSNPSAPKTYSITVDGKTFTFPDKKSLNNFKMSAGIK